MTLLYHYTCAHRVNQIRTSGVLRPNGVVFCLVWLTDMELPDRLALGLTSQILRCDRTEYRVTVDTDAARWVDYARNVPLEARRALEFAPGALPMHWWVSTEPVPVVEVARVAP